ncbi:UNVERIFIED_CONTAM: Transcription factor [Sesamum radiatum]|uniref:Transcription factor n=1 Tax=Sesamum radiatum TaxID=300843 RepID=A0AAW2VKR0_SESRA
MAGNPNWWSMNSMHPQLSSQFLYATSTSSLSSNATPSHNPSQDFPVRSWSQLLLGGGEEERYGGSLFQQQKKLENWEDQVLNLNPSFTRVPVLDVKQEIPQSTSQLYNDHHDEFQANHIHRLSNSWPPYHQLMPVSNSSPTSCITTLSSSSNNNNILNFSDGKAAATSAAQGKNVHQPHNQDHSSECNSTSTGAVSKKPRVQQSSAQPALKVRKEKLGDRITALHQLVSPFGKTDTASVLSEAIGYIRFLQAQIEALSSPYMRNGSGSSTVHHQHSDTQSSRGVKDLRSRGLCLVPISCTQNVENDGGATDYWAPAAALGGGF